MITWYQRLQGDYGIPMRGIIRVEVSQTYLEATAPPERRTEWITGLAWHLYAARSHRLHDPRMDCSLMPIHLLEDRLHAMSGDTEALRYRLRALLGLACQ